MKWFYLIATVALTIKVLVTDNALLVKEQAQIVWQIVKETGIPNAVSGIILRNRLYDTLYEVVVFTIAILGASYLLQNEKPRPKVEYIADPPSVVLARVGATITAIISIELAIRGHLSPGGGFAAGTAGGTAIGLVAVTASIAEMQVLYQRWKANTLEKLAVICFAVLTAINLSGVELPRGEFGSLFSGSFIPILNVLVAIKVALGSWAVILLFVRYRGLL
jgi:multicomponent Na+:H+ antiporter subunit B